MTSYIIIGHIFVNLMKPLVNHYSIYFWKNVENLVIVIYNVNISKNTIFFKYQYKHEPDRYKLYFIVFLDLENIGLDTLFVHLRRLVFKLGTQIRSAIMAALNRAGDV